jgi:hypothetical protein
MMSAAKTATKNVRPLFNRGRKALECTGTLALVAVASLTNVKFGNWNTRPKTISKLTFEYDKHNRCSKE